MDFSFWKKLLHVTVVILCGLSVVTGLSSCEEDFDPWEIATLEMRGSQEVNIPNINNYHVLNVRVKYTGGVEKARLQSMQQYLKTRINFNVQDLS